MSINQKLAPWNSFALWVGGTLTIIILAVFTGFVLHKKYSEAYEQLQIGASKDDVLRLFGNPSEVRDSKSPWFWVSDIEGESNPIAVNRRVEFSYGIPLSPDIWSIGLDANGKVVYKVWLNSP